MSNAKLTWLKVNEPKMDLVRNPRQASSYDFIEDKELKALLKDMDENGFRSDKPIVVSDRGKEEGKWVVQGHRRLTVAREINRRNPSKCQEVPALVYTGMTLDDERRMLIDQFLVKKLNEYEQYLAVKQLLLVPGMTEERIGQQVGMSRGWVQRRVWIARFPAEVENEWKKRVEGKEDYLTITDAIMVKLKAAYESDKAEGRHQDEGGGPAFRELWASVKNRDPIAAAPKALTRADMLSKCDTIRDKIITSVIRYCAGDPVNISDVIDQLAIMNAKANNWDESQRVVEEEKQA